MNINYISTISNTATMRLFDIRIDTTHLELLELEPIMIITIAMQF